MVDVLSEISKYCDIYLMERTLDDESEVLFYSMEKNAYLLLCVNWSQIGVWKQI